MTPLPLFNLRDYQCPSTFTVTPSKLPVRNQAFWDEVPRSVVKHPKMAIHSKEELALIQYVLMVRRNKFKIDLWFEGPNAEKRRSGLAKRMSALRPELLLSQPVYQDFK